MTTAQNIIVLNESIFSRPSKEKIIEFLTYALKMANYHRTKQYSYGGILGTNVVFNEEDLVTVGAKEALSYLIDKRILTPTKTVPAGYKGFVTPHQGLVFRVDFERAVAYYRMLTGTDPDFIEIFPEQEI